MKILITGAAGFIGFHLAKFLISEGHQVIGIDSLNDYYEVSLKKDRLKELGINESNENVNLLIKSNISPNFKFSNINISNNESVAELFKKENFNIICHLAAQAGVRYSIDNPQAYIDSNILGFFNILENARKFNLEHLIYASSSSVYGNSNNPILNENDFLLVTEIFCLLKTTPGTKK